MAFGKIYVYGPTFRAEKSKTRKHLTEFWMVEPEVAYFDLEDTMKLGEEFVSFAEGLQKNTGKYLSQDVPGLKASFRVPDFVDVPSIGNGRVGRLVESKAGMAFDEIVKSERFLKDFMEQLEDYATIARHIAATREGTMELIIYFRECACVPEEILRRLRQMGYTVKRMP